MDPSHQFGAHRGSGFQVLWDDGECTLCRTGWPIDGAQRAVLAVRPTSEYPTLASVERLVHEYGLREELESTWAARPLKLLREGDRTLLLLEDPGGEPLVSLLTAPLELGCFLRLAISIVTALSKAHQRGLIHKDLKPGNILVNANGEVRLTGFGIASHLARERQAPEPPETIAGTLAYMAPEQTGRMNRSIDARSDLYALGVTLYEMLTGTLPFTAADPMELVHCHIARKPVPPGERVGTVPATVSAIIMKLLAKTAEERYQTASGVERDLQRCVTQWEHHGHIEVFPLGRQDTPDRLLIPEKLYGRDREVQALLASFNRIVRSGTPELVLVSGYAGIGKSAVVNELHKALVPRGLFAAGKFDQLKREIPYATLALAFQGLVRLLLGKSDTELTEWRDALLQALGPNGRLMVDIVPDLKFVIGEQPPVPELPPQDAPRRFQWVLQRFIGVFARAEHPLVLFLDDLQWLDAATLDLLDGLLTGSDLQHLMLIGAYRNSEVTADHPLMRKLEAIKAAGGNLSQIALAPLAETHLRQLIADALHCKRERAAPLAQLVHEKTGGNPFFVIQFLYALAEEGFLTFDHEAARWSWDVECIRAMRYTDNVVDLMVDKLSRLPAETQTALPLLACLGNAARVATVSIVLETPEEQVHAALWPAVRQELIERLAGAYRFVHDRVQEAAYSLISPERRSEVHLQVGRLLAAHTPAEKQEEAIFDVVNHLNRGATLIVSQDEREQLAELNLIAGQRAKASAAYASALTYLAAGATLLPEDAWERRNELSFALELQRAESEFATGALTEAEARLAVLSMRAGTTVQRATVACLRVDLYMTTDQNDRAVVVGLDSLRDLGIDWPQHPTEKQARREYERIWSRLGSRTIEELHELPLMSNPDALATMELLIRMAVPAYFSTTLQLFSLAVCRAVNLSLEHGHGDASCVAYELFAMLAGPYFDNYDAGFRFSRLGYELSEKPELKRFQARTLETFGFVCAWTRHVRTGRDLLQRAFHIANRTGDLTYAGYACAQLNTNLLMAGDPLDHAQSETERGLQFANKLGFGAIVVWITGQLGLIRTLRGLTTEFGSFDDGRFNELDFERYLSGHPALAAVGCWYWIRKLQARFLAGGYPAAADAAFKAQPLVNASPSVLETAEYHFYGALTRAACWDRETDVSRQRHFEALTAHYGQLQVWARNCPDNFENRAALVGAEVARIEGRALDAMDLYEQAIRTARANGFVHNEALANEIAARFYAARGFQTTSRAYVKEARFSYIRWGADGKVRQLDALYPYLRTEETVLAPTRTVEASVEQLDLATVISVSQAVSDEIVLDKLIAKCLRTALEYGGAERGLLMLTRGTEQWVVAEATTGGETVIVQRCDAPVTAAVLPESVLHYVVRTQDSLILDDAAIETSYAADPYIDQRQPRSILCLPLTNQAKLIGALYLENNLASCIFTPSRIAVLKLLASQAAITLENARLYRDQAEREAKIRRLVEANIIGIVLWDFEGRILEANDAFLRIVGYDRDDLVSGRVRWTTDLTPSEWRDSDARAIDDLKLNGIAQPFEKEYLRKNGSLVPVLVGAASLEENGNQGVAFVLDLSERKRAEAELRQVQMELAHANRVATLGQLTASIAHEVKQPIGAAATNAAAAIHWLRAQPAHLQEVRQALDRIVNDMKRAGDILGRIREHVEKAPPHEDNVDVNEAVREVIELTRGEAAKHDVSLQTVLGNRLPPVRGDRVQLQQVMLNLIVNAIEAMSAMRDGPRDLRISTTADASQCVSIAVSDSGPGLPTAEIERVFDPFYTTKAGGLGMGLSICRTIVDAHGGQIWAKPNVPRGTVFQFALPSGSEEHAQPGDDERLRLM
ncbi:trifunctional serine/threonine-protein kinase/ATP-binding protein/sensor histidine kinase [Paraburkholderia rhizosphaerae]|uniref:histidine kinase n=1 Tax=Paraburkholderia rhizosphaerae TaxID=480658 RepID=A0A4R8LYP5_9BURK|nr:trifunctional serine/threonine-protein kinase/ATP-binding protein/sensor histidine kinase [Paraburkholderia rhizosphaerae]TDY52386.1 PAS domain S-box-containing protein [Paraburkholderia rhizosphaerae]